MLFRTISGSCMQATYYQQEMTQATLHQQTLQTNMVRKDSSPCQTLHYIQTAVVNASNSQPSHMNSSLSGCHHSARLDDGRGLTHLFGVVHWGTVLSNIKTVIGCELNSRQLQLRTVFALQWLCITNSLSAFKDGMYTRKTLTMYGWHQANAGNCCSFAYLRRWWFHDEVSIIIIIIIIMKFK